MKSVQRFLIISVIALGFGICWGYSDCYAATLTNNVPAGVNTIGFDLVYKDGYSEDLYGCKDACAIKYLDNAVYAQVGEIPLRKYKLKYPYTQNTWEFVQSIPTQGSIMSYGIAYHKYSREIIQDDGIWHILIPTYSEVNVTLLDLTNWSEIKSTESYVQKNFFDLSVTVENGGECDIKISLAYTLFGNDFINYMYSNLGLNYQSMAWQQVYYKSFNFNDKSLVIYNYDYPQGSRRIYMLEVSKNGNVLKRYFYGVDNNTYGISFTGVSNGDKLQYKPNIVVRRTNDRNNQYSIWVNDKLYYTIQKPTIFEQDYDVVKYIEPSVWQLAENNLKIKNDTANTVVSDVTFTVMKDEVLPPGVEIPSIIPTPIQGQPTPTPAPIIIEPSNPWGGLSNLLNQIVQFIMYPINAIIGLITGFLNAANGLLLSFSGVSKFFAAIFGFLPIQVVNIIIVCTTVTAIFFVLKLVRG